MISLTRKFQGTNYRRMITGINYVIFNGGAGGATLKYSIPDQLTVTGTKFSTNMGAGCSAGTTTFGLFVAGQKPATQVTYKYVYSGDVIVSGAAFGVVTELGVLCAAGNAEVCLVSLGTVSNASSRVIRKYTYADDTVTNGTPLTFSSDNMLDTSSTGNKEFAFFRYNFRNGNTDRFDFATDVVTAGAVVSSFTSGGEGSHTGNGVIGIMSGSPNNRVNKITFASNTCALGTNLPIARQSATGMCGTTSVGVFNTGGSSACALYNYASDTTASAAPDFNSIAGSGVCANPTGVNV